MHLLPFILIYYTHYSSPTIENHSKVVTEYHLLHMLLHNACCFIHTYKTHVNLHEQYYAVIFFHSFFT